METRDASLNPKGYQKVTGLNTVKTLTVPAGTRTVLLKCEGQSVRWRDDSVDPTAADGFLLDSGEEFLYAGKPQKLRFIETAASGTLHVNYYG